MLPLGTRSGEWYLSSFTVIDLGGGGSHTETYPPTAPYLVRVVDLTQIRSTSPEQYVGYGDSITVSGVLEGGAGYAVFTGDDTWRCSFSFSGVQVRAVVSAKVNDSTAAVRQSVKITGKVTPGAMPV